MGSFQAHRLMDEFREVVSLPGYFAGVDGCIYSCKSRWGTVVDKRRLAVGKDKDGYHTVQLWVDGKNSTRRVHRLVAEAFSLPRQEHHTQLRHLNGDKDDNRSANLVWGTAVENAEDREIHGRTAKGTKNGSARLTEEQVLRIRVRLSEGASTYQTAREFEVSQGLIWMIKHRKKWGWL